MTSYVRTVSEAFQEGMNSAFTAEYGIMLIEAEHPDLPTPLRLCNARKDQTFEENLFQAFPFSLSLPGQGDSSIDDITLRVGNGEWDPVDGLEETNPVELLRRLEGQVLVRGWFSEGLRPDDVIVGPFELTMHKASADVATVSLTLTGDDLLNRPACSYSLTPATAPGAFE